MNSKNPWTTLKIQEVYDNPWIKLTHREVLDPSGNPGIYGKVHFKNIAVGAVPMDEENNIWLVGQYRYTLEEYCWEIPEGGCIIGKDPLEAAKRELKEETGIQAKTWTQILEINTSNSVTDEYGIVYLAKDLSFGKSNPESTEDIDVKKIPFQKAYEMVMNGEMKDSLTIAAIMKIQLLFFS